MQIFFSSFISIVFALNTIYLPVAKANQDKSTIPATINTQQLITIKQHFLKAQQDLNDYGYVSKTTLVGLSGVAAGIGIFTAGSSAFLLTNESYDVFVKIGNAGHALGFGITSSSPVLTLLAHQVKELLGSNLRSDLNDSTKKLISIMDESLMSNELTPEQAQMIFALKNRLSNHSDTLSRNPWYIKMINIIDVGISLLSILTIGPIVWSGQPGALAPTLLIVPASAITFLLRAVTEVNTIRKQIKLINESIEYIDTLIQGSRNVMIIPLLSLIMIWCFHI